RALFSIADGRSGRACGGPRSVGGGPRGYLPPSFRPPIPMAEVPTDAPVFPLGRALDENAAYEARRARFERLLEDLRARAAVVRRGGGPAYVEREHARGKLTA